MQSQTKNISMVRGKLLLMALLLLSASGFVFLQRPLITWAQGAVELPSRDDVRQKCLHDPIWPGWQTGAITDVVTISAETFETVDTELEPVTLETNIWFRAEINAPNELLKTCTANGCTADPKVVNSGTTLLYGCQSVVREGTLWSGWRRVNVGLPSQDEVSPITDPMSGAEAVKVLFTGDWDDNVDIVFIASEGDSFPVFLASVRKIIGDSFQDEQIFLFYRDRINFWVAPNEVRGEALSSGGSFCGLVWPPAYNFAETTILLQEDPPDNITDCTSSWLRGFSEREADTGGIRHQVAQFAFGLADEYSKENNDYWQLEVFPNVYEEAKLQDCRGRAKELHIDDGCQAFRGGGKTWYRLDSQRTIHDDIMTGEGAYTVQKADKDRIQWYFEECSLVDCPLPAQITFDSDSSP